ncbi:MAG: DUF3742 family protein [Candidatus Accumulibacter sp.]|jgi:hypothetical protein|nr:DUF3742 family protein [Accumulibacter sp.]
MKPNTLKPVASSTFAERFGRMLGRAWRGVLRLERNAGEWLMAQGLPAGIAKVLPLTFRLAVLGVALYVAFWLTALLVFAVMAAEAARNTDWETPEPERRNGLAGHGLYTHDGVRIDPYIYEDD